jgi:hypothetical protein
MMVHALSGLRQVIELLLLVLLLRQLLLLL